MKKYPLAYATSCCLQPLRWFSHVWWNCCYRHVLFSAFLDVIVLSYCMSFVYKISGFWSWSQFLRGTTLVDIVAFIICILLQILKPCFPYIAKFLSMILRCIVDYIVHVYFYLNK